MCLSDWAVPLWHNNWLIWGTAGEHDGRSWCPAPCCGWCEGTLRDGAITAQQYHSPTVKCCWSLSLGGCVVGGSIAAKYLDCSFPYCGQELCYVLTCERHSLSRVIQLRDITSVSNTYQSQNVMYWYITSSQLWYLQGQLKLRFCALILS